MAAKNPDLRPRNLTFPIQCDACSDVFDVAADAGERSACPMCGHSVLVAEAEEFELECPEGFVIEEATAHCLRYRRPTVRNDKIFGVFWLLYGLMGLGLGFLLVKKVITEVVDWDLMLAYFLVDSLVGGPGCLLLGLMYLRGFYSIELNAEFLCCSFHLGSVRFKSRFGRPSIERVFMEKTNYYLVRVQYQSKTRTIHLSDDPDKPRYITHLLRRQLKLMGHDLTDGRR